MAVTASGLYVQTFISALTNAIALDLSAENLKVAMFTDSITPNFTSDTAYGSAPYNANEVSGTGYPSGGATLANTTVAGASGALTFDADDVSFTSSTITNAKAALIYADALATNDAIVLVNFGANYSTNNGTFLITWDTTIFSLDLTP